MILGKLAYIWGCLCIFLFQIISSQATSAAPIWSGSKLFQTATISISPVTNKKGTVPYTYPSAFAKQTLLVCWGLQSVTHSSPTNVFQYQFTNGKTTSKTGGTFSYTIGSSTSITAFSVRYLAIDKDVKTISTFEGVNLYQSASPKQTHTGSGTRSTLWTVNFTQTTKMTLNVKNNNVMLLFAQTLKMNTTNGGSYAFRTSVSFLNINQYLINLTTFGNTIISSYFYSRMIYDQTAIQASQTTYLDGGDLYSTNSNYAQLATSFYYSSNTSFMVGLNYFSSLTSSAINWSFDVNSIKTTGTFQFHNFSINYWNYRYRNCPQGFSYFNQTDNLCYNGCNTYYFPNSTLKTCNKCHYSCLNCTSNSESACTVCNSNDDDRNTVSGNKCSCKDGFYDSGVSKCSPCSWTCATCSTQNVCTSCPAGSTRQLNAGQCLCPANTFDTGTATCGTCEIVIPGCKSCTAAGSLVKCVKCDPTKQMTLNNGICVCGSGYGLDSAAGVCELCSILIDGCLTCSSQDVCTACKTTQNWNLNDAKCVCSTGYYNKSKVCSLCSDDIIGCVACNDITTCTACKSATPFYLNAGQCLCPSGFYGIAGPTCSPCSGIQTGCLTCNAVAPCLTCDNSLFLQVDNGVCICKQGYYGTTTCTQCMIGCKDCNFDNSICNTCKQTWNKTILDTCICSENYYLDTDNICKLCSTKLSGCLKCTTDGLQCLSDGCDINQGLIFDSINNVCVCNSGYYPIGNPPSILCSPCMPGCPKCSDSLSCSQPCVAGYLLINNQCQCNIGFTYDSSNKICVPCSAYSLSCSLCEGSGTTFKCTNCGLGFDIASDYCKCNQNFNSSTLTCDSSPGFTGCNLNQKIVAGVCQNCPPGCSSCDQNDYCYSCDTLNPFYSDGTGNCPSCNSNCKTCLSASQCLICNDNFILRNGVCTCQAGKTLDSTQTCKQCFHFQNGCQTCTLFYDSMRCLSCITPHFVLNTVTGKCQCSNAGYSAGLQVCSGCNIIGCSLCHSDIACKDCDINMNFKMPAVPGEGGQPDHCQCVDGFYYQLPGYCEHCQDGCLQCQQSSTCIKCDISNFFEKSSSNECVCKKGFFKLSGQCQSCQGGCLQCDSGTLCRTCDLTQKYQNDTTNSGICVCVQGFYQDAVTQNCQPCSIKSLGCLTCTNLICLSCNQTLYIQNGGVCLCKDGFYSNGITCASCAALFNGCTNCNSSNCTLCDINKFYVSMGGASFQGGCQCDSAYTQYLGQCKLCEQMIMGCSSCATNTICGGCKPGSNFVLDINTGTCNCDVAYFLNATLFPQTCILCNSTMDGCIQCTLHNYCEVCNDSSDYQLNSTTGLCECKLLYFRVGDICMNCSTSCLCDGYYQQGLSCHTKCGDGILVYEFQECDDGNNIDGDGCSLSCILQPSFTCKQREQRSFCSYNVPIDFVLMSFSKDPYCNCLIFKLSVEPQIQVMNNLDFVSVLTSNLPLYNGSFTYSNGQLVLTYQYNETLQQHNVTFYFTPFLSGDFEDTPSSTFGLQLILPSNQPIVVYQNQVYDQRLIFTKALLAAQVLSYVLFFVGLFCNKIIGLEMMGVLQIAFFVLADMKLINPLLAPLLNMKSVNGINVGIGDNGAEVPIRISAMSYKSLFVNNFNVMLALPIIALLISLILFLIGKFKPGKQGLLKLSKHILKEAFLTATMFSLYNITFSAGLQFLYRSQDSSDIFSIIIAVISLVLPVTVISLLSLTDSEEFGEFKNKFLDEFVSRNYFFISIVYRGILGFLIAYQNTYASITIVSVFLSIMFLMYLLVNTPYRQGYHNYRAVIAQLATLTILSVGMYYRSMKANSELQSRSQILNPAIIQLVMIFLCIGMSLGSLVYEMYNKFSKYFAKDQTKEVVVFQSIDSMVKETDHDISRD